MAEVVVVQKMVPVETLQAGEEPVLKPGQRLVKVYQPAIVDFEGKCINEDDEVEITLADGSKRMFKGIWRMVNGQFLYDNYVSDDWRKINEYLEPWWARFAKFLPWLLIPICILIVALFFR